MPVLTRSSLEASPLADLHELASELELDGFRRLRKADLVDRILEVHGGGDEEAAPAAPAAEEAEKPKRARRSRRPRDADADSGDEAPAEDAPAEEAPAEEPREERRASRPARESRESRDSRDSRDDATVEGVVELLGNGSGFVRVNPPDASDEDRLHLCGADPPLRARRGRSRRRPGPSPAALGALPVARPRRHDQRPVGRRGRRRDPLRRSAVRVPQRAVRARFSGDPTLTAIEFLHPDRARQPRDDHRPGALGQERSAAPPCGGARRHRRLDVTVVLTGARPEGGRALEGGGAGGAVRRRRPRRVVGHAGAERRALRRHRQAHRRPRRPTRSS